MKSILIPILAAFFVLCSFAQGEELWDYLSKVWKNPKIYLNEIQSQIRSFNPEDYNADNKLTLDLKNFAFAINQEIIKAESPNWASPTPERKAVIQKWANILAPVTQELVDLAFDHGFGESSSSVQARSVLDFAPATPAFADEVRKYMHQSLSTALRAADLLFEHRLLTDADKETLRGKQPAANQESELEGWAVGMSSFGMLDGLKIAKNTLLKKPKVETPEEISTQYGNSIAIASLLGPDAAILLPEIEALIADPAIISSGYLNHFKYARDVITGKEPRQVRTAKNGSGPLSPWLIKEKLEGQESGARVSKPSPELQRLTKRAPKPTTGAEKSLLTPRWPLVAVVVLAVFGLLWLWLKKRK